MVNGGATHQEARQSSKPKEHIPAALFSIITRPKGDAPSLHPRMWQWMLMRGTKRED
jgi:hypothetical protein